MLEKSFKEGEPLEHPLLNRSIGTAQKRVEGQNYTMRKRLLQYDDVLNQQRQIVYALRNRALAAHHVTVHAIEGRLAVSLDLEVDGTLSLAAAHDIATGLEDAIREELVTSLSTASGPEVNLLTASPAHCRHLTLPFPVIDNDELAKILNINRDGDLPGLAAVKVSGLYRVQGGAAALRERLEHIFADVSQAVRDGKRFLHIPEGAGYRNLVREMPPQGSPQAGGVPQTGR